MLTVGSLFAGIGGLELGLERTGGFKTVWQVENDEFARQVLERRWPDVERFGDVCKVRASELRRPDLLCGGFPCQDLSFAGRGEGIGGARSGLWWEFHRIIRDLAPSLVLVENVPALLYRGFGVVLGSLASIGYDAEWDCIPAAAVGAPHRRDRLFIVAHARRGRGPDDGLRPRRPVFGGRGPQEALAHADGEGPTNDKGSDAFVGLEGWARSLREGRPSGGHQGWRVEPGVGRVADGVSSRVDRLRVLGNAVVPQVAEWIGYRILESLED